MCGIAGVVGDVDPVVASDAVALMLEAEFHRGPDAGGQHAIQRPGGTVVLGNRRLAIIDTSQRGVQPMIDAVRGDAIAYNGELYNFRALHRELVADGAEFSSGTDTEVVLRAYQRWGVASLDRLVGMYAFAIWDAARSEVVVVRDRLGIKPVYFHRTPTGVLVFASEIRALLASGLVPRVADPAAVESFLAFGAVQGPSTILRDVSLLEPAHVLTVAVGGTAATRRYWSIPFPERTAAAHDPAQLAERVGATLTDAVERQLVSDVPVGLFLSGGIDSSAIAIAAARAGARLDTFSINFNEAEWGEGEYAKLVADQVGSRHQEVVVTTDGLLELLPRMLASVDQPTYDGVNVFVVSEIAKQAGVKVVLSGQGGDEIFGGYSTFKRLPAIAARSGAPVVAGRVLGSLARRFIRSDRLASSKRIGWAAAGSDLFAAYRVQRQIFAERMRRNMLGPGNGDLVDGIPAAVDARLRCELANLDPVNQVSKLELEVYLANTLLRDGDVMSMANSIEVRVPLLDDVLVDLVTSQPGAAKTHPELPKPLLLAAVPEMPREVYARPKQGFTLPWPQWLRSGLRDRVGAVLEPANAGAALGVRQGSTSTIWNDFLVQRKVSTWDMVWALFVLLEWTERHRVSLR